MPLGGTAHDGSFDLGLLLNNSAGRVRLGVPRLEPSSYDVVSVDPVAVRAGGSMPIEVRLRARCTGKPAAGDVRLVLPVVPESGRAHEVAAALDPRVLENLTRQSCGFLTAAEAAEPQASRVTSTRYAVHWLLAVHNRSARLFTVNGVTGPALALTVVGGLPVTVLPHETVHLTVTASLPACALLPPEPPHGQLGAVRFGSFTLQLGDADGSLQSLPYLTDRDEELYSALVRLRGRICPPGSFRRQR